MKVLFVCREYPPFAVGGIARHTYHLVSCLRKQGITCKIVSFGQKECSTEDITFLTPNSSIISKTNDSLSANLKIPLDILRLSKTVNQLTKKEHFDIVHVQEPLIGAFVRHRRKITTVHTTSYGDIKALAPCIANVENFKRVVFFGVFGLFFDLISSASSRTVIVPFAHIGAELSRVYLISKKKIRVIVNGTQLGPKISSEDKVAAKQKLGLNPKAPLILTIGRFVYRKRFDTMIDAAALLKRQTDRSFKLVMIGTGPLSGEIEKRAQKYALGNAVEFTGWVSDETLERYLTASDISVLTSEYEGAPLSLLETMSHGAAMVCTRIDGSQSLIRDGIDGLLFETGDAAALSKLIAQLIDEPSFLKKMSSGARAFAERFDWNLVAKQTATVYRSVL
jgi:1,4-alpha-glucan branching enzyme